MAVVTFTGWEDVGGTNLFVRAGQYSYRATATGAGTAYDSVWGVDQSTGAEAAIGTTGPHYITVDFAYATKPASGDEMVVSCWDTNSNVAGEVRLNSDGKLSIYNQTPTLLATGTKVLDPWTWYRLKIKMQQSTSGAYRLLVDDVEDIAEGTSNFGSTTLKAVIVGKFLNRNSQSVDFFFDNLIVDDAAFASAATVVNVLRPEGDTSSTWTVSGGSSARWTYVDDTFTVADTTAVVSPQTLNAACLFTLQTPASRWISGTILGVKHSTGLWSSASGARTTAMRLRSGSTNDDSSDFSTNAGNIMLRARQWLTDPNTSAAWTLSGVAACQIGHVDRDTTGAVRAYMDCLEVLYTPDTPTATRVPTIIVPRKGGSTQPRGQVALNSQSQQYLGLEFVAPMTPQYWGRDLRANTVLNTVVAARKPRGDGQIVGLDFSPSGSDQMFFYPPPVTMSSRPYTLACWAWFDTLTPVTYSEYLINLRATSGGIGQLLQLQVTTNLLYGSSDLSTTDKSVSIAADSVLDTSRWHHVALTDTDPTSTSASTMALYVDGVNVGATGSDGSGAASGITDSWGIGDSASLSRQFDGALADVRVYSRALSAEEIWRMYDPATRWELYTVPSWRLLFAPEAGTSLDLFVGTILNREPF